MVISEKDKYKNLIESSPLFSLDKETESTSYKRETYKMVDYLYRYLMACNSYDYESYAVEIVETAKRCMANYKPDLGPFINYFNSAWKQTFSHIQGKSLMETEYVGMHFTETDARNYRKFMKLAQYIGADVDSVDFEAKMADAMGVTVEDITELKKISNYKPSSDSTYNDEGDEFSVFDQIDSGKCTENEMIQTESAKDFLDLLESVFDQLQNRQKSLIKKLITSKIVLMMTDDENLMNYAKTKTFFDQDIYEESIKRGENIQVKEIAELEGLTEASVSRSWKVFREKLSSIQTK